MHHTRPGGRYARVNFRTSAIARSLFLLAGLVASSRAEAQVQIDQIPSRAPDATVVRPDSAQRVVRVFDFEEQATNPTPVPFHFIRTQNDPTVPRDRPGFPPWNAASLDYTQAYQGAGSVILPTQGGSTAIAVEPGVIPIFANADYLVRCWVQTTGLTRAGAAIEARLLNRAGMPIRGAVIRSEAVTTSGRWTQLAVEVPGESDDAAFLQIELQLLQPEQAAIPVAGEPPAPIDQHRIWPQDYSGSARFDNLSISQLPRIELQCTAPGGVVLAPEKPKLDLVVRDLTGEPLTLQLSLFDAQGRQIDSTQRQTGAGRTRTSWTPKISQFGWYRAVLEVLSGGQPAGQTSTDFIYLPPSPVASKSDANSHDSGKGPSPQRLDAEKFGLVVQNMPDRIAGPLASLIRRIGPGAVTIPVWNRALTRASLSKELDKTLPLVDSVLSDWREVTLSLSRVPDEVAVPLRLDAADPWSLLASDRKSWSEYLDTMLDKYGQVVRRWQIGSAGDDLAFWLPKLDANLASADAALSKLVPGPIVAVPWRIDRGVSAALMNPSADAPTRGPGTSLIAMVPQDSGPGDIELFASHWQKSRAAATETPELTLAIESPSGGASGPVDAPIQSAALVARRVAEAWAAFSPALNDPSQYKRPPEVRLSLIEPWVFAQGRRPRLMPAPELAAWRTAMDHLSGRTVVGEFPAGPGLRCFLLAPREATGTGAIVAWNESAPPDQSELRAFFGLSALTQYDLFGNASSVRTESAAPTADRRPSIVAPTHVVPLTDSPVYIEGVDIELVRFIAGFRIDPAFIVSTDQVQEHSLVLSNPWSVAAEGQITIVQPGGFDPAQGVRDRRWTITPRSFRFSIAPGQTQKFPFGVSFSPSEDSGKRDFVAHVELAADRSYGVLQIATPVEIGLKGVRLELAVVAPDSKSNPDDLLIEARIINTSAEPLNIELAAFASGFPRSKAGVAGLGTGAEAIRRFSYPGGRSKLKAQKIVVGLSIPDTGERLNRSVTIE